MESISTKNGIRSRFFNYLALWVLSRTKCIPEAVFHEKDQRVIDFQELAVRRYPADTQVDSNMSRVVQAITNMKYKNPLNLHHILAGEHHCSWIRFGSWFYGSKRSSKFRSRLFQHQMNRPKLKLNLTDAERIVVPLQTDTGLQRADARTVQGSGTTPAPAHESTTLPASSSQVSSNNVTRYVYVISLFQIISSGYFRSNLHHELAIHPERWHRYISQESIIWWISCSWVSREKQFCTERELISTVETVTRLKCLIWRWCRNWVEVKLFRSTFWLCFIVGYRTIWNCEQGSVERKRVTDLIYHWKI